MENGLQIKSFEKFSNVIKKKCYSPVFKCAVYEFENCGNHNQMYDGFFAKSIEHIAAMDFAIRSASKAELSQEENFQRNKKIKTIIENSNIYTHQLVGYWQFSSGKDCSNCKIGETIDTVELTYFIPKPKDMDYNDFKQIIIECLIAEGDVNSCLLHRCDDGLHILNSNGTSEKITDSISEEVISQAFSQEVKRVYDNHFVFIGDETPTNNWGKHVYCNLHNYRYYTY